MDADFRISWKNIVWRHEKLESTFLPFSLRSFRARSFQLSSGSKEKNLSTQATYDETKFFSQNWPPGENDATRRERYGDYVELRKRESQKMKKYVERGGTKLKQSAPANGLLVEGLIPVAGEILAARNAVIEGVERLLPRKKSFACSACYDIFIGPEDRNKVRNCRGKGMHARNGRHLWISATSKDILGELESFHLWDRLATMVTHDHRLETPTLPSVVELCLQAGVEMKGFPVLRRKRPIYGELKNIPPNYKPQQKRLWSIDDMLDEKMWEEGQGQEEDPKGAELAVEYDEASFSEPSAEDAAEEGGEFEEASSSGEDSDVEEDLGSERKLKALCLHKGSSRTNLGTAQILAPEAWSWDRHKHENEVFPPIMEDPDLRRVAERTITAWLSMRNGVAKVMSKYPVLTCGYCPEVHVGPRGHKVRLCDGGKHQWRNGQHGWQRAVIDDIVAPKYVFHVLDDAPFFHELRAYYGMAPAVVELCVQSGARIPDKYLPTMRLDVVIPDVEELELAV